MYAHYFKHTQNGKTVHQVRTSETPKLDMFKGATYIVSGKREARQLCKAQKLTPWNF